MRLLVLNAKMDVRDPNLGVMTDWVEAFAERVEHVTVVSHEVGDVRPLPNVTVRSCGKELERSRLGRVGAFYHALSRALDDRPDACFVHMMPVFTVLAAPLLRARGIPVVQWYAHRATPWQIRVAHRLADRVVTASPESFRIPSRKVVVTGHGIDTSRFVPSGVAPASATPLVLTVGRIAPSKNLLVLLEAIDRLRAEGTPVRARIVGGARTAADEAYASEVRRAVRRLGLEGSVRLDGPISRAHLPATYGEADVFVNLSETGSLDKAFLEAMSCSVPVVSSNDAHRAILRRVAPDLAVDATPDAVADAVQRVLKRTPDERAALGRSLRAIVVEEHDVNAQIDRIIGVLRACRMGKTL